MVPLDRKKIAFLSEEKHREKIIVKIGNKYFDK
jgi:hypothetical protein